MAHNRLSKWKRTRNWLQKAIAFFTPSRPTLTASGIGIFLVSLFFFTFNTADGFFSAVGLGYYLLTLCCYLLIAYLIAVITSLAIGLLGKTPPYFRQSITFVIFFVLFFDRLSWPYGWIIIGSLIIFPALLFGGLSSWRNRHEAIQSKGKRLLISISFFVGIIGLGLALYFFLYDGKGVNPIKNYKMLAKLPPAIEAPDPSRTGKRKVSFLSYGSGTDKHRTIYGKNVTIKTPSVNASFLLKSWTGISGRLRTAYFGFNETALPLNAMVWYPADLADPAPLVLIVHGNHLAQDWSEPGYDYLAEMLASRGYIVASVDENFLNGSFTDMPRAGLEKENGTRGWLMLKHLELWRQWNQDPSSPFYRRIDMDNIALMGHSRGGEAMSHAALFNNLPCFPDNANEKFNFHFPIRAYVAIAPVDGQYKPASILAPLEDINYFVIQGTHDMDMQSYGGLSPYKRIKYSPSYKGFKAGLYVHHANHGQFNTSWGKYDASRPFINQFNMTNLMSAKDQEQIAKVYIGAFLDINLRGLTVYKPMFIDYRYGRNWLPKQIYFNQYEASESTFLARYEEDLNLTTATASGVNIQAVNLSVWREAQHNLMWGDHLSRAAYIGWNREEDKTLIGEYTFNMNDSTHYNLENKALVFSLATSNESSLHIKKGQKSNKEKKQEKNASTKEKRRKQSIEEIQPIDFTIALEDRAGHRIHFLLSSCSPLQAQLQKKLTKVAFLNTNEDAEAIPDFFYFDLDTLKKNNAKLDLNNLRKVSFIFDQSPSGVIALDDIGFMSSF